MPCAKKCANKIIQLIDMAEVLITRASENVISNPMCDSLTQILEQMHFAALEMQLDPCPDVMDKLDHTLEDVQEQLELSYLTMQAIQHSLERPAPKEAIGSGFLRGLRTVLLTLWTVTVAIWLAPALWAEYGFWIFSAGMLLTYPIVWCAVKLLGRYGLFPDRQDENHDYEEE